MARYSRSAWQVIAVAAFAATATLAVTVTRQQPTALTETIAACRTPGLDAWMGVAADPGAGARPSRQAESAARHADGESEQPGVSATSAAVAAYYTLEFTNVSDQVCSLSGYPGVWASNAGQQIGSPATPDPSVRPSTVTLAPGATAHAMLRYTVTGNFDTPACAQITVRELRVYLPHAGGALTVPLTIPACSRKGPDFLTVQAVQPRAGIPGFPRYLAGGAVPPHPRDLYLLLMRASTGTDWMRPSVRLWRMRQAQVTAAGIVVALAGGLAAGSTIGAGIGAAVAVAAVVAAMATAVFLYRKYRSWAYREREEDLLVSRGVLVRRVSVVPYGRMQFVEVTAGPAERWFRLATVQLHTAAAASNARIPGLEREEAARLRDRLAMLGEAKAAGL